MAERDRRRPADDRRPSRTRATCRARPAFPRSGRTARCASRRGRAAARSARTPLPSRCPTCRAPRTGRAAAATPRAASAAIRARGSTETRMRAEIDPAALARRLVGPRCRALARVGHAVGANRAQPLALPQHERRVIVGDDEAVDLVDERLGLLRAEVEHFEPARQVLVAAASVRAGDGHQRPHDLVAGNAGDLVEASFGHRERRDAPRDAGEVDAQRRRRCRSALSRAALGSSGFIPLGSGSNGGRACRPAAQSGTAAPRAESSARTARCRRRDRTCAATGSTGTCPPDRTTGCSRGTRAS